MDRTFLLSCIVVSWNVYFLTSKFSDNVAYFQGFTVDLLLGESQLYILKYCP
jgi:hypothetical protein